MLRGLVSTAVLVRRQMGLLRFRLCPLHILWLSEIVMHDPPLWLCLLKLHGIRINKLLLLLPLGLLNVLLQSYLLDKGLFSLVLVAQKLL